MQPHAIYFSALLILGFPLCGTAAEPLATQANVPVELAFTAQRPHADPFRGVSLDVRFTRPTASQVVPAFWAGGATGRRVCFAVPGHIAGQPVQRPAGYRPARRGGHGRSRAVSRRQPAVPATAPSAWRQTGATSRYADGTPVLLAGRHLVDGP